MSQRDSMEVVPVMGALKDYVLSIPELSKHTESNSPYANIQSFISDFKNGRFRIGYGPPGEDYVLYWKGILAGHSHDKNWLFKEYSQIHGSSNTSIFRIPTNPNSLEDFLKYSLDSNGRDKIKFPRGDVVTIFLKK